MSILRLFEPPVLVAKGLLHGVYTFLKRIYFWLKSRLRKLSMTRTKPKTVGVSKPQEEAASFRVVAVGTVHSVYKEKFGTPRQGNMVPDGRGSIVLDRRAVDTVWSLHALEEFSHVWVVFIFHTNTNVTSKKTPSSKVRPPQGAGAKVGVFATRSPHRPNPIGLTMARLKHVDTAKGVVYLEGLDLCDGTPVLDIKPYCENVDWPGPGVAVTPKWVTNPKFDRASVSFSPESLSSLKRLVDIEGICEWYQKGEFETVKQAIEDLIALDPRDLNRGRGAFSSGSEESAGVPVKETSFTRREQKLRDKATVRSVYVRFDVLDVTFKPDESTRGFLVVSIERYSEREVAKRKAEVQMNADLAKE